MKTAATPPPGIPPRWWARLLVNFRVKPYGVAGMRPILSQVSRATEEGLPVEAILVRLVEGVVKQADEAALAAVVRRRVEAGRRGRVHTATHPTPHGEWVVQYPDVGHQ